MATVNGKIVGIPALVDNLALVYNKKLFAAGRDLPPTANWTWTDFQNAAMKLTNPAKKQFGWAYVNDASEDTVWRYWAMLWQAGGSILTPDGKKAAFDSPAGVKALTLLQTLATAQLDLPRQRQRQLPGAVQLRPHRDAVDRTVGPGQITRRSYGVTILPADLNHQTISGPDNWVRVQQRLARATAAVEFMKWFTSPAIDLRVGDDDRRPADPRFGVRSCRATRSSSPSTRAIGDVGREPAQRHAVAPGHDHRIRRSRRPSARRSRRCCSARRSRSRRCRTRPIR